MASSSTIINNELHSATASFPTRPSVNAYGRLPWVKSIEATLDGLVIFAGVRIGFWTFSSFSSAEASLRATHHLHVATFMFSCVLVLLLDRAGAYRASGGLLRVRETACILETVFIAASVLILCLALSGAWNWVLFTLIAAPLLTLLLILQKYALCAAVSRLRSKGVGLNRVLIYGTVSSARMLYRAMERSPKLGFLPVAMACEDQPEKIILSSQKQRNEIPIHTCEGFHASLVQRYNAETVIVASPMASQAALEKVITESSAAGARVVFGAEAYSMGAAEIDYIELDGQMVYGVHQVRTSRLYDFVSRTLDITVSLGLLLCAALPMAVAALAIALETKGPILFRQIRIGRDGRAFTIYKFRTMHQFSCGDKVSPADSTDPRITRTGRWLRRTSLDELPQLFNVLRGDMALVGPRPEMGFIVATYSERQRQRLSVKPGITGIWQISADRRYPIHENLHYDLYYLKHRSVSMDIALLFHTLLFAVNGI